MQYIVDFLSSATFSFAIFLVFAALGALFSVGAIKALSSRTGKKRTTIPKVDVSAFAENAKDAFLSVGSEKTIDREIRALSLGAKTLAENLSDAYFANETKRYDLFVGSKFLPEGVSVPLEFGIYEILDFMDAAILSIQLAAEKILLSKTFNLAYAVFEKINKTSEKNPRNLSVSIVVEIFSSKKTDNSGTFSRLAKAALKPLVPAAKKIGSVALFSVADNFLLDSLDNLALNLNDLCHGDFLPTNDDVDVKEGVCLL